MSNVITLDEISNLDPVQLQELSIAMSGDSCLFAQVVMSHVVRDVPTFHRTLYSYLNRAKGSTRSLKYIAAVLFRGAAKSTIKVFDTVHDVCHAHEPVTLFLSEAEDQSIRDLISVQDEIESNDILRGLYGDLKGNNLWNRTECEFANGAYIAAKGWKAKVRGIKWKLQRPTKLWLDDFEGEGNTRTEPMRVAVSDWVEKQVMPAGDIDPTIIMLGTIVHPNSYLASIKDLSLFSGNDGVYMEQQISGKLDGTAPAWPGRYPVEWIKAKRQYYEERNNLASFLQEYYNIPSQVSAPKFNLNMVEELVGGSFGKYGNCTYIDTGTRKIPLKTYIGVDVASSTDPSACRTVIFVLGVIPGGKRIIIDIYADRIDFVSQINRIYEYVERYAPTLTTVETYGYQKSLYDWLRHEMTLRKKFFALDQYKENKSKSTKYLEGLCPIINTGKLAYLSGCHNIEMYLQEARSFSGGENEHNDTLDGHFLAEVKAMAPQPYDVDAYIERLKKMYQDKSKRHNKPLSWKVL